MALAATAPDPARVEALAREVGPVDWLLLLDTSAEMLPLAEAARTDVASLVGLLPAGDSLEILAIHTRAVPVLPRTVVTEDIRGPMADALKRADLESAIDQDLGAGLEALGEAFTRRPSGRSVEVLVLSRFCHSPSVTSPYDTGTRGCRAIRGFSALKDEIARARGQHDTWVRLFPTAPSGLNPDPGGLSAAEDALDAEVVSGGFGPWVAALGPQMALERVRPALAADTRRAALKLEVVEPGSPDAPQATLEVVSGSRLLEAWLVNPHLTGGSLASPEGMVAAPTLRVPVDLQAPKVPFALFPRQDTVAYPLSLAASVVYEPADVLGALGLPTTAGDWSASVVVEMPRSYGLPSPLGSLILGGVALGAAGAAAALRLRSIHRELGGSFHWRLGLGPRVELDIGHLATAAVVVEGDQLVLGAPERAALVFRLAGPRWRTVAEVEVRAEGVEMNRRPLPKGVHPVTPGAASFHFSGFRLTWE